MQKLFCDLQQWLSDYIKGYYNEDADIQKMMALKEKHTNFVVENSKLLAENLELDQHDVLLCQIIGLLHDVGRFPQYTKYRTFNDRLSENHAKLGLTVLNDLPLLMRLNEDDRLVLETAIINHNAREISAGLDERTFLFARIIRDADKLDIYRVLKPLTEPSDGSGYSDDIIECLLSGRQCDYTYIKTLDDRKLVRLLWLYNVYFTWTLREITNRGYVDNIINNLPQDAVIRAGVMKLKQYITEKTAKKDKCIFN